MKVLWFSLDAGGSAQKDKQSITKHGWMVALENAVKVNKDITLEIAYFSKSPQNPFVSENVKYYPICYLPTNNLIRKLLLFLFREKYFDQIKIQHMKKVVGLSSPDLIHVHGTEEAFGYVQDLFPDIPVVFSIQGIISPYLLKYYSGIPKNVILRHENVRLKFLNRGINRAQLNFEDRSRREIGFLKNAKYVIGRTDWDKNVTYLFNQSRRYFVVNELLRENIYNYRWKGNISDKKVVLISTISQGVYKGFETVLLTSFYLKQYSKLDFEWQIIGLSESNLWKNISEKYTGVDAKMNNIKLLGWKNADEIGLLLSQSDIFVQVSHIENSPNSLCEAMLVGIPCIASDVGGTSSMLENGKEGVLIQDGDAYSFAGAILHMINKQDEAISFGNSAHIRAFSRHNKNKVVNELLSTYKQILIDKHTSYE